MLGEKGNNTNAIADLDEAINLNPQSSTAYNNRCNFYRRKSDYPKAMRDCNEAIKIDPKNAWALDSRGDLWRDMRNYNAAVIDYTAALQDSHMRPKVIRQMLSAFISSIIL
jgi:tetratricopeptide (TPR) repeat protein